MGKATEAHSDALGKGKSVNLSEIGLESAGIEPVSENDIGLEDQAAFMNDLLTIVVTESNEKDSLPVVVPSVNGINQPIVRGQKQKIKRKYVEALARCTHTRYEQSALDPSRPENIQMVAKKALVYPFVIYDDPHPHGREWLQAILREA
jgi:hypothetical protein